MNTAPVIGANGFLGSHVTRQLVAAGHDVRVMVPAKSIPLLVSYALATLGSVKSRLRGTDERLSLKSLRLMPAEPELDHGKAVRELGWQPRPVEESIREAARFWVNLRNVKRESKTQA